MRKRWGSAATTVLRLLALLLAPFWFATPSQAGPALLGDEDFLHLGAYISLLDDPDGRLKLADIRSADAAGRFHAPPSTAPGLGYRTGATWVRFSLTNSSAQAVERWLVSRWPNLQFVTLYLVRDSNPPEFQQSGTTVPIAERPLRNRLIVFPIRLAPGETLSGYLRLSSKTSTIVDLELWDPGAYASELHTETAIRFFIGGTGAIIIVFSLLIWQARQQPRLLSLGAAHIAGMLLIFGLDNFFGDLLPYTDGLGLARAQWSLLFIFLACQAVFTTEFLQLRQGFEALAKLLSASAWASFGMAAYSLWDFHPPLFPLTAIGLTCIHAAAAITAGWRKSGGARLYFVATVILSFAVVVRMGQQLGVFAQLPFIGPLPVLTGGLASLALAYALYLDIRAVREERETSRRQLAAFQHSEQERLQAAVESRTQELHEAISRAETANQAKTAFLSVVSHELRTPLHTILGYTQLLQRQLAGEARDKLAIVANSSSQLLSLIDDVLDFSRGEAFSVDLQLEAVNLHRLCRQLEESSRLLAGRRNNHFSVELDDGLPQAVLADEQRLTQLLQNLIGNACKYTERGTIRLIVAPDPAAVCETPEGTWYRLCFTVSDTGPGIPAAEQEHIFEPFARASSRQRQPGVGLGLAIARQLARAMGGDITVDSEPGRGSDFRVLLPLQAVPLEETSPTPVDSGAVSGYLGRRLTLLVADDIAENRTILKEMFSRLGFNVVTAEDGAAALRLCQAAAPPVDAALVDQFMPNMDGWGFLRAVRESDSLARLPVILISAAPPKRPPDLAADIDFDHKLMKPLRLDFLASLLQQKLGFEWTTANAAAPNPAPADACRFPPPPQMAEFRDMLVLGKVLALQRWALSLAQHSPEYSVFCEQVVLRSRAVDLAGLKRLLDEAEEQPR